MIRLIVGVALIAIGFFGGNIIGDNVNWIIRKLAPLLCYIVGFGLIVGVIIGYILVKII